MIGFFLCDRSTTVPCDRRRGAHTQKKAQSLGEVGLFASLGFCGKKRAAARGRSRRREGARSWWPRAQCNARPAAATRAMEAWRLCPPPAGAAEAGSPNWRGGEAFTRRPSTRLLGARLLCVGLRPRLDARAPSLSPQRAVPSACTSALQCDAGPAQRGGSGRRAEGPHAFDSRPATTNSSAAGLASTSPPTLPSIPHAP